MDINDELRNQKDAELRHHLAMQKLKENPNVASFESNVPLGTVANTTNAHADSLDLKESKKVKNIRQDFIKLVEMEPMSEAEAEVTLKKLDKELNSFLNVAKHTIDKKNYWKYPGYRLLMSYSTEEGKNHMIGFKNFNDEVLVIEFIGLVPGMAKGHAIFKNNSIANNLFKRIPEPSHDKVVLMITEEAGEQFAQSDSGLYLSDKKTKYGKFGERLLEEEIKYQKGIIVAKGPGDLSHATMEYLPSSYSVGDEVIVGYWGGTTIDLDNEEYKIVREYDIVCKIPHKLVRD